MTARTDSRFFYGWAILVGCFLMTFSYGFFYSLTVFFNDIREEFSWSSAQVSSFQSVHLLAWIFAGITISWLTEKYNPRLILGGSAILTGVSIALLSQTQTLTHFYIFYIGASIGMGGIWAPPSAIIQRWFIKKRGLTLGIMASGIGFGAMVYSPLAYYLISHYGWRQAYLVEAAVTFGLLIIGGLLMVSTPEEVGQKPYGAEEAIFEEGDARKEEEIIWTLGEAIKTKTLISISIAYFFTVLPIHLVAVHIVPFAVEQGIHKSVAATVWGLIGFVSIFGKILLGNLGQSLGYKRIFIVCTAVCGIAMFAVMGIAGTVMLYGFVVFYGFFYGGKVPQIPGMIGSYFGTKSLAPLIAFAHSVSLVGGALGPLLAGYLHDRTNSYHLAFTIGAISWFLAGVLVFTLVKQPLHGPDS
jgi:MFS family permease